MSQSHFFHHPFGSTLPTRSWSDVSRVYRYGFNGKEKDSETANDNYDFGARIYDGRLGRWLSLDPLMKKYASLTPFNFVNSNPIVFIDEDGRDYGVYIDHNNKTVIIKQTFHVKTGDSYLNASIGAEKWNSESNKWQYLVNGVAYSISYQITIKEYNSEKEARNAYLNDNSGEGNYFESKYIGYDHIGNTGYYKSSGGYNYIEAENSQTAKDRYTYAHEIGHTLGLDHFNSGIMKNIPYRNSPEKRDPTITLGNVSRTLSYAGLGKPQENPGDKQTNGKSNMDKATVHTIGIAPDNFNTGNVQMKQSGIKCGGSGMGQLYFDDLKNETDEFAI